jgi:hypothetical protein
LCRTNILRKVVQFLRTRLHSPRLKARHRSRAAAALSLSHTGGGQPHQQWHRETGDLTTFSFNTLNSVPCTQV